MVKIITYINNPFDVRPGFSRTENKTKIFAEDELDRYLQDGWEIVAAPVTDFPTSLNSKMTVIMKKF